MKTASTMAAAMAVTCLTVAAGDSVSSNSNTILVGPKPNYETLQAKVVKVFAAEDNGAKFRAYQVKWKGFDVVISDTLGDSDTQEGESLTFLASRSSGMAPPTLHFTTRNYHAK